MELTETEEVVSAESATAVVEEESIEVPKVMEPVVPAALTSRECATEVMAGERPNARAEARRTTDGLCFFIGDPHVSLKIVRVKV
jgi:hypothetical protein